ncbi:MAG: methionyl-tRNA formyltransferase [bacterium]
MKVVFLGTPQIALPSLEYLIKSSAVDVLSVVTQPDRPSGRGHNLTPPPIKLLAQQNGIQVFQTESIRKDKELIEKLRSLNADFFVTVAFGQILSQEVLNIPKYATINLHASLLPEYRGANPLQRAIVDGKKYTGVTTMLTVLELDAGDMLLKKNIEITEEMTMPDLANIVSDLGAELLEQSIIGYANKTIIPQKQDESQVSYANKFKKEDGFLSFHCTSVEIHNKIRGLLPWPCVFVDYQGSLIKLLKSKVIDFESIGKVGEILKISKDGIEIQTKKGIILIKMLQPQNKKTMNAFDWANGTKIKVGETF